MPPTVGCAHGCSSGACRTSPMGSIADLRFEHPIGQNFTPMAVETGARGCPAHVTDWQLPRRDVLTDSSDSR